MSVGQLTITEYLEGGDVCFYATDENHRKYVWAAVPEEEFRKTPKKLIKDVQAKILRDFNKVSTE